MWDLKVGNHLMAACVKSLWSHNTTDNTDDALFEWGFKLTPVLWIIINFPCTCLSSQTFSSSHFHIIWDNVMSLL